ncbi:GNAT family N-acetyltransferase [Streptomyces sp. NPDC057302]|uniref:GNAT family N-acetyltransferase n=1 Tax=Streptomyces sp. NPDC057302 TaxID=3346094 RepID=UPI003636ACE2
MTLMTLRPNTRAVKSSWHSSVAALPAERRPATPFHSREWAAVWQSVHTEQVRGRALVRELGTEALVIANIPPAERTLWREARTPDTEVVLPWAHRARVGASVDEFIANFPSEQTGRDFREQHRQGTDAGLTLKITSGTELLPHLPQFTDQARSTSELHGPALYGTDMFTPLTRVPGAVALLAERSDGSLAGGLFGFRYGSALYLWATAVDRSGKDALHTYDWLMYESVKYAAATGAHVLDTGRGNYAYAARLGMLPVALTSAVYLTRANPPPRQPPRCPAHRTQPARAARLEQSPITPPTNGVPPMPRLKHILPTLAVSALLALTATTPASADGGWWHSRDNPTGAKAYFKEHGDKVTVCDTDTDGYKALVQVMTFNESLAYQFHDNRDNSKCTSRSARSGYDLFENQTYKFRVCIVKIGTRPLHCSSIKSVLNDH